MSTENELLIILLLIYVIECTSFISRKTLSFRSLSTGKFSVVYPSSFVCSENSGLVVLDPLPFGRVYMCNQFPISFSNNGIYSYVSHASNLDERLSQIARFLRYDDIKCVTRTGNSILINEEVFIIVQGDEYAEYLTGLLNRISKTRYDLRVQLIRDEIRNSLDKQEIDDTLRIFLRRSKTLRYWCISVFLFQSLLIPCVILTHRLAWYWQLLVAIHIIQLVVVAKLFAKLHRFYYPHMVVERWSRLLSMILVPPSLIRCLDHITTRLISKHHPLAIASVLCDQVAFVRFARYLVLDLQHPLRPICPTQSHEEVETEKFYREILLEEIIEFLNQYCYLIKDIVGPPSIDGEGSMSYCPRCCRQFVLPQGNCYTCGGIPLQSFHSSE